MNRKKKILFLSPYPKGIGPSQRFRFEQYLDFLSDYFDYEQKTFWDEKSWNILFSEGKTILKIFNLIKAFIKRLFMLSTIFKFDIVFIHREVAHVGPPIFEWLIVFVFRKKVIYDFDDAIWRLNYSQKNPLVKYFKAPWKVGKICKWSYAISCGNDYLADFAKQYNENIHVIPTTIDMHYHVKQTIENKPKITIGWTGTLTTLKHIDLILPMLKQLEEKYEFKFIVISNDKPSLDLKSLEYIKWKKETEIEDLSKIDIGVMPLPDEEWEKGKCGFKGLQYMALGVATIMSPVGVNSQIIQDGENGLLASSDEEWVEKLIQLIESEDYRKRLGDAGRKTIVDKYSVEANKQNYLSLFTC